MLLGVLSDSHGDGVITARAIAMLEARGATRLIHCGDICGDAVLSEFAGHHIVFVWGNCDAPSAATRRLVKTLDLPWPDGRVELEIAGRRIAVFHGHEPEFADAIHDGRFHYVFYGHTHRFRDERVNGCRIINPGALHRAAVKTVGLLNVETDELIFLRVDNGEILAP